MRWEEESTAREKKRKDDMKRLVRYISWGFATLILLVVLFNSMSRVEPGYAGVQYSLVGGLKEETLDEGLKWHAPWVNIYEYPVSTETVNLKKTKEANHSIQVNTGDGKSVEMDITYAFKMEQEKLPHIFKRFRRQSAEAIAEQYIKQEILNTTQNLTTKNSVLQVYSQKREEIANQARDQLTESLAQDGIILEKFTFSDVRPDEDTKKILQQVADAENQREVLIRLEKNLEQEAHNLEQQKANEQQIAEADKAIAIVNANKAAEVIEIEATAQATANEKLAKSITQTLVDYEIAKKADKITWPKVYGGGNMLQLPGNFLDDEATGE